MQSLIETNWLAFAVVLGIGLLVAWWLWGRSGDKRERYRSKDALDEGAAPAQRNQALIDAPSAAARVAAPLAASGPGIMAGLGEAIAAAAAREVVAATPVSAADEGGDDLTRIKGVGPKLSARLRELGVTRFAEIAAWTEADVARIDAQLGSFAGRPVRDSWVEQAGLLAAGDTTGFEDRFGKI